GPWSVTFLPGAILCAARKVWADLGGFREEFFLYQEDVDLCLRAGYSGVQMEVVPAARVWHFDPPRGPVSSWLEALQVRNLLRLSLLHAPARVLPGFLARNYVWDAVKDLAHGRARAWYAARAWVSALGELPALLRERRQNRRAARPHTGRN